MTSDSFMIVEGDRAGTATPSHREKSLNRLRAVEESMRSLIEEWASLSGTEIVRKMENIRAGLDLAKIMMHGGDDA